MRDLLKQLKNKVMGWIIKEHNVLLLEAQKRGYDKGVSHATWDTEVRVKREMNRELTKQDWLVNPDDVFTANEFGIAFLNGQQISQQEAKNLKSESKTLQSFQMWKIFQETLRQKAIDNGMVISTNWENVQASKLMLYNLGIMKSILKAIDSYNK